MFTKEISIRIILYKKYAGVNFERTVTPEIVDLVTPNSTVMHLSKLFSTTPLPGKVGTRVGI